jgi:RNA polymerase sigma factor (sigma-70 family)
MSPVTDSEIIIAIKTSNNNAVLSHLYKSVLPKIKRFIIKNSGSEDDAKDIFQDAVIILFNQVKLNKFDETKEIGGFMYSVARNLWINKVKRQNKQIQITDTEYELKADIGQDSLNGMITNEKTLAIKDLMNQVGEECKQLLKYSIYDRLSMKEICEKMGYSSESVAKTYNYRCKQKLVNLVKNNKVIISLFKE